MNFLRGQHISFCSFLSSCVLRETSIGVDYTQREERLREKKGKMYVFTITSSSPAAHHREKKFFFREIKNF